MSVGGNIHVQGPTKTRAALGTHLWAGPARPMADDAAKRYKMAAIGLVPKCLRPAESSIIRHADGRPPKTRAFWFSQPRRRRCPAVWFPNVWFPDI